MLTGTTQRGPSDRHHFFYTISRRLRHTWSHLLRHREPTTPWDEFCAQVAADERLRDRLLG